MATTSVNPLDLAEIVATVLSYVEGKGSLFACVQVNKLWAEEATTCLWSNSPPLGALRTMPSYVRQQHYASKVVKLRVSYLKPRIHQQLTTLQFSRLAYLYISECHDYDGSSALQYLQPALREFECGREVSDSILRHLAKRCPRLESLSVVLDPSYVSAAGVSNFLATAVSLTSMNSPSGSWHGDAYDTIWPVLAAHPHLEKLQINDFELTESVASKLLETVDDPFPQLKELQIATTSKTLSDLLPYLPQLTKLDLDLGGSEQSNLFPISECTNLTNLTVRAWSANFSTDFLLSVAAMCRHLKHFKLGKRQQGSDDPPSIQDIHIEQLALAWPDLELIELSFPTNITHQALKSLGCYCHRLKVCELWGEFSIMLLDDKGPPLFPCLEVLWLHKIVMLAPVKDTAQVLRYHTPLLKNFLGHDVDIKMSHDLIRFWNHTQLR